VSQFEYSAWFRDECLPADQQDHEWIAVFLIEAESKALAKNWGDHLASSFSARRSSETFLSSEIRDADQCYLESLPSNKALPLVRNGIEASDSDIGW
jgi:hypothetical protein